MNFLLRSSNQTAAQEQAVKEAQVEVNYVSKAATTLEGLISEDPVVESTSSESGDMVNNGYRDENGSVAGSNEKSNSHVDNHIDVTEEDGLIVVPNEEIPDSWVEAPDINSFRSMDRSFVFAGEQVRILACLSAYKQDTEIITPFKVAAAMSKNGTGQSPGKQNGNIGGETSPTSHPVETSSADQDNQNGEVVMKADDDSPKDGESLIRMEDHKRQTELLLQRFRSSHFFARIAESDEPLWSKRRGPESSETFEEKLNDESLETLKSASVAKKNSVTAVIDRGKFDARTSGGVARGAVQCRSLSNGDIVVLLQVNIGVEFVTNPILEILQFEKYQERNLGPENQHTPASYNQDPSGDLLKWLLPLDNSIPPAARPLTPPTLSSSSSIRTPSTKPTLPGSSGSQLFSFGHFRSYSMSSLPPNATPPPTSTTPPPAKLSVEPEDWSQFSFRKFVESGKGGKEGLLSFRGVPLEPERFSVRCGLEGIFTPGRRWRRKIDIIQPVEIRSVSVDCNTDDLLCVIVKNVSPAHVPDIVVFIDAITIVFEEASNSGPTMCSPLACIEAGNDYGLPNLALRRGEEHSFILKPATTLWKHSKVQNDSARPSRMTAGSPASSWHNSNVEGKPSASPPDQYAILVSCRCNYTESKLFFKQPTTWRPRISRDLMISVASEMSSRQTLGSDGTQLPVQVLTLQASNMTSEDLTLTVLAPASFTSPPSVVTLSNSPSSPLSSAFASGEFAERVAGDKQGGVLRGFSPVSMDQVLKVDEGRQATSTSEERVSTTDAVPNSDLGCTHLWLQSRVPLGCVPSQSTSTIKLEVLPLTDGIITLDSLRIDVKEKGLTYVAEQSLKINARSSIATGIK